MLSSEWVVLPVFTKSNGYNISLKQFIENFQLECLKRLNTQDSHKKGKAITTDP